MSVKVYFASKMTGRDKQELMMQAWAVKSFFGSRGITVIDPISLEGVYGVGPLKASDPLALRIHWARDKHSIREANVVVDLTADQHSHGVSQELGYARWFLWKPVVRIFNGPVPLTVARFEDDLSVEGWSEAAEAIVERWGTREKRLAWRARLYARCWPKAMLYKLKEWK